MSTGRVLGPHESRSVYRPTNDMDQLHGGPVGREFAAFTAAVREAQRPLSGGGAFGPSAPSPATPQLGGAR